MRVSALVITCYASLFCVIVEHLSSSFRREEVEGCCLITLWMNPNFFPSFKSQSQNLFSASSTNKNLFTEKRNRISPATDKNKNYCWTMLKRNITHQVFRRNDTKRRVNERRNTELLEIKTKILLNLLTSSTQLLSSQWVNSSDLLSTVNQSRFQPGLSQLLLSEIFYVRLVSLKSRIKVTVYLIVPKIEFVSSFLLKLWLSQSFSFFLYSNDISSCERRYQRRDCDKFNLDKIVLPSLYFFDETTHI